MVVILSFFYILGLEIEFSLHITNIECECSTHKRKQTNNEDESEDSFVGTVYM